MKKNPKKKKKNPMNINLLTGMTLLLLLVGIGFGVQYSTSSGNQELRGHAAEDQIQLVSKSAANTGSVSNATSVTFTTPKNVQAGDVMVALLQADYGHIGGALPAGWVLIKERNENDDLAAHTYYKIAGDSEPASYTWKIINTDPTKKAQKHEALAGGTIMAFRGVDTQKPIFASAINPETKDPTKIACPSVNAPAGGILLCEFVDDDPATTVTVPASMTRVSYFIIHNNDTHAAAYEKRPTAGQTGTRVASIVVPADQEGNGNNDIGIGIALQPAAAGSATVAQPAPSAVPSPACLGCSPSDAPATPSATVAPPKPTSDNSSLLNQFLLMMGALFKLFADLL